MRQTFTVRDKAREFIVILFPILITQLSLTATSFFDTVMSGNAGHYDLAGVAIGANLWMPVYTGLTGVLIGITPVLAQFNGAGRHAEMPFIVVQGIYLAAALTLLLIAAGYVLLAPVLNFMNLDDEVHRIAYEFLTAISMGFLPLFLAAVLRNFIDSLGHTRITMMITLCAVPLNVLLNYLLIFGQFGFPRLGGVGAGYASAITYWVMFFIAVAVVHCKQPFRQYHIFGRLFPISLQAWGELLKVGAPIGIAIFCEVSIFAAVALLIADFGTAVIAAHQAAINFASLIYMVPLSIGMALTIVIGFEVGAGRLRDAEQYSYLGIGIALAVAIVTGIGLFIFNKQVAQLYTQNQEVLHLARNFLAYAILFQLSDAIAAPIQGALRGYKDVKMTLIMAIVSYWVIGAPTGYLLAKYSAFGPYGYWIGLITGLAVGATVLSIRLVRLQRRKISKEAI